jgi:hypothetical protein
MAIQTKTLNSLEHDWYATRSAANSNAPLSQHQRDYWEAKGSKTEREWLQTVGSSTSIDPYELWVAACQAQSAPVGVSINDCKYSFFNTVTAGTNP